MSRFSSWGVACIPGSGSKLGAQIRYDSAPFSPLGAEGAVRLGCTKERSAGWKGSWETEG